MTSTRERAALSLCFGDDDDEAVTPSWLELHAAVPGLSQLHGALSSAEQRRLLEELGWLSDKRNQRMLFGLEAAPGALRELSARVSALCLEHALLEDTRPFNQAIINCYAPGEGLRSHVDLAAFADGVVVVSFLSSVVMDFSLGEQRQAAYLRPGDILALQGEARWSWAHGIAERAEDIWDGRAVPRGRRLSITLRRMAAEVTELRHSAD